MNKSVESLLVRTKSRKILLETMKNQNSPLTISKISRLSGLNWATCRNLLTELVLTEKVEGFRIGRVLGFKLKKNSAVA